MKRKVFSSLLLILAVILVSCEIEKNGNNPEVVVIDFSQQSAQERGMTKFPDNIPFYDTKYAEEKISGQAYGFWISGSVMRSLPILPGMKTMYIKDLESALKDKTMYGYGFPLQVKDIQITSDGIFILYEVLEENRAIGQIEYYYSIKDKKFSYREIVSPLLGEYADDTIFIFELFDVPVKKTFGGCSFKAGRLYNNGSKFNLYYFPLYHLSNDNANPVIDRTAFIEQDIHMNYNNNEVNSASLGTKFYNEFALEKTIDVSNRKEALNIEDTKEFLSRFFKSPILTKEKLDYITIEDFNQTMFVKSNDNISDDEKALRDEVFGFPTSFNLHEKIAATINSDTIHYNYFKECLKEDVTVNSFKDCGYTAVKTDVSKDYKEEFDAFVISMFKKLGLDECIEKRQEILSDFYNPTT